jgi:hypothetical protein
LHEPDQVARGVAEGAVAQAIRLVERLLDDLDARFTDPLEGRVAVLGGEDHAAQHPLGHELRDRLPVGGRRVGVAARRFEHDRHFRLRGGADGHPAHALVGDIVAHLKAEQVAVEGQCLVMVVDSDEAIV